MIKPTRKIIAALIPACLLAACTVGPDYQRPAMELPDHWPAKAAGMSADKPPATSPSASDAGANWWTIYNDAFLDQLETEALRHNADVQLAVANILQARAQLGITEADQSPVVTLQSVESRTQSSLSKAGPPSSVPRIQNSTNITLNASYELDLWGKLRRASEAARAELLAAESTRDSVRLSLTAEVARQYFSLQSLDAQEAVLQRILEGRQERLKLDQSRLKLGAIAEYDLHQSDADVATVQGQLVAIAQSRDQLETALAVLLGRSPGDVLNGADLNRGSSRLVSVSVPAELPAELLLRRPDLKAAESHLEAMNANIGVLRAEFFPSISLTSYLGSQSSAFSSLFSGPAGIFQFAANIGQPIFNAGRLDNLVQAARVQRDQALIQYRKAVASAFADIRNALSAQDSARKTLALETTRSKALETAYDQAKLRYQNGISSHLELLDVERNYFQAELNRLDAERAQRAAVADLFKALGGGWQAPAEKTGTSTGRLGSR